MGTEYANLEVSMIDSFPGLENEYILDNAKDLEGLSLPVSTQLETLKRTL